MPSSPRYPPGRGLIADPTPHGQTLLGLAGNAVKFTTAVRVTVSARATGDWVEMIVSDTAVGIEAGVQPFPIDEFR